MRIDNLLDSIISTIKSNAFFDSINVIKAYPDLLKPTRIKSIYIALGIAQINLNAYQLDSSDKAGEIRIFADIIVPLGMTDTQICDVFTALCRVLDCYNILSVSSERSTVQRDMQARILKTTITINDEISFGGDADE